MLRSFLVLGVSSEPCSSEPVERSGSLLAEIRLTRSLAVQWTLIATMGFFLFMYLFAIAYDLLTGRTMADIELTAVSPIEFVTLLSISLLLIAVATIVHEVLHGVAMARYGGKPEYGVGVAYFVLPYAYAESQGTSYTRNQTLVVLLTPLVVITLVGFALLVAIPTPWLLLILAANAAGSIGDVWMALVLLRYPPSVRVYEPDDGVGLGIYGDEVDPRYRSPAQALSTLLRGTLVGFAFVVGVTIVAIGWAVGAGASGFEFGVPGTEWYVVRLDTDPTGASMAFDFPTMLGLSGVIGVGYAVVAFVRHASRPS